jgi:hypothetical protein
MERPINKHMWRLVFVGGLLLMTLGMGTIIYATFSIATGAFPAKTDSYLLVGWSIFFFGFGLLLPSFAIRDLQHRLNVNNKH